MRRFWLFLALTATAAPGAWPDERAGPEAARFSFGGELSASAAPKDRGFFNDTTYSYNALRLVRLSLSAGLRVGPRLAVLGEVRTDNFHRPRVYTLFVRARPWTERAFDVQAGLIPPVFGSFARRPYGPDNPLIGSPLAYHYLTSWRPDALPASADELLNARGGGWRLLYPIGSRSAEPGLPLVNAVRRDAGVQVRIGSEPVELSASLTQGTLSSPRVRDDNDGKQLAVRVAWRPLVGLVVGASGARGEYLDRQLRQQLAYGDPGRDYLQRAWGLDFEYSRGYWVARAEAIWSAWDAPELGAPALASPLRALALSGEGRYRLAPGLHVAGRVDRLDFGRIAASSGLASWDASVWRVETGLGYSPWRRLMLKAVYQYNWRDGGFVRSRGLPAAQALIWF